MPDITLDPDQIKEIKTQTQIMTADQNKLAELYKRYQEIYFMENVAKPKGGTIDDNDWKITVSPSGRNAVTGMKRLLDTSEIHVRILVDGDPSPKSDDIERGLLKILDQSGAVRIARVEKDLNLSAVLYGPAILAAESVDDLIQVQTNPAMKAHFQKIRKYCPFLLRALPPPESFSRWGELGMMAHVRKYVMTGDSVAQRWGVADLKANQKYTVYDYLDMENRVVWIDSRKDVILAKPHKMPSMNISAKFAGGSSLFSESDKQMQSFLYAHTKGEWDRRENLFWTYLFTALFMQGLPGPLLVVDPESVPPDQALEIDFTGGVRKIFADAKLEKYPVVDGDVLQIKGLMDAVNGESTIYRQTLGENIQSSTFSGLAMLSSAGQLPLEDPKEAICSTFRDIFEHILCRVKQEGIDSPYLHPEDIPEEYEIEIEMEPKLPQDNLRNSQIAAGLQGIVSQEWILENVLQVGDAKAMKKQAIKERMLDQMVEAMMGNQEIAMEMINAALGRQPQQQPPEVQPGPTPPEGAMPAESVPPEAMQAMMQQQGIGAGMPGSEQLPATGPMPMQGEPGGPQQY